MTCQDVARRQQTAERRNQPEPSGLEREGELGRGEDSRAQTQPGFQFSARTPLSQAGEVNWLSEDGPWLEKQLCPPRAAALSSVEPTVT